MKMGGDEWGVVGRQHTNHDGHPTRGEHPQDSIEWTEAKPTDIMLRERNWSVMCLLFDRAPQCSGQLQLLEFFEFPILENANIQILNSEWLLCAINFECVAQSLSRRTTYGE
jgi:hypothetical protein